MDSGAAWTSCSLVQSQTSQFGIVLLSWPGSPKNAVTFTLLFLLPVLGNHDCPLLEISFGLLPSPPTDNLICVCVCLHVISFQETNPASRSAWASHINCGPEQKDLDPPLLSVSALSAISFLNCEEHQPQLCHPSTQHGFLCITLLYIHIQAMSEVFKSLSTQHLPDVDSFPSNAAFCNSVHCKL